jgi:hypothetical protein
LTGTPQFFGDGQEIQRDAFFVQTGESLPDPAVSDYIEIVRLEELGQVVIDFGVNQHSPYNSFFGFPIVGD